MNKLIKRAKPTDESFREFHILMEQCSDLLQRQVEEKAELQELEQFMKELVLNQEQDGMWRMIFSEDIPYDARVCYWKYPTILFTSSMINFKLKYPHEANRLKGFKEALFMALDAVEKGRLTGHGFDSFNFRIDALKTLLQAEVMKFIKAYPLMHKEFNEMIHLNLSEIERNLKEGTTRFDFNCEFRLRMEEIVAMAYDSKEVYLFVYGTLMSNYRQGRTYLDGADFKGKATLNGFALYDLGYYPGIVEDLDGRVKGELYSVSKSKLPQIDNYEAEGTLYKRKVVKINAENGEGVEAYVYVYNKSVEGRAKIDFKEQPWFQGIADISRNYVWYACYGSNINKERFMKYINQCTDKTPPKDEKPMIIEHPIYFANRSRRWSDKGVAFLDISRKGMCYGKRYLVTREQFEEIHDQEGNYKLWYNKSFDLGSDAGIPIKTITHAPRDLEENIPSSDYLKVIKTGIQATYPNLAEADIDAYLLERFLKKEEINLLTFLRSQEHGVTVQVIEEGLGMGISKTVESISILKETGIIRQDGRSITAGEPWNSADAVYYTIRDKREAIDKLIYNN